MMQECKCIWLCKKYIHIMSGLTSVNQVTDVYSPSTQIIFVFRDIENLHFMILSDTYISGFGERMLYYKR